MAPTGSDGTTTDLAAPDTADAPSGDAASPFGDWREQLRERVKEIRARKHSDRREDQDELGVNLAATEATAEKLEMARAQSQEVPRGQPTGPEAGEEPSTQLVGRERASRRADIAGVVDELLGGPEPSTAMSSPEPVEPMSSATAEGDAAESPDAPDAAPLFQEEPRVFADDPILEIVDEFERRVENTAETNDDAEAEIETESTDPIAADGETAPEMEANIDETPEEEASAAQPIDDAELPDNSLADAIPPELRDVDIPTWALPREPSRSPQARAAAGETDEPDGDAPDTFLVGDYTTPADGKRTDLGPPPDTPIPTADLLDKPIGDLLASSEAASSEAASSEAASAETASAEDASSDAASAEEKFAEEQVEIAPPGSLVDAADFEPGDREEAPAASRSLPGLFDMTDEASDEQASKPDLFFDEPLAAEDEVEDTSSEVVAAETPAPVSFFDEPVADGDSAAPIAEQGAEQSAEGEPASDPGLAEDAAMAPETAPAEGGALEWDVDNELDAELVAAAQRQHTDASAPLSDRVYSAVADGLVLLTIGVVLVIAGASAAESPVVPFVLAAPIPFLAAWSLFGLVYGVMFVGTSGQTLGKMAMRVRVIGADTFHVGYGRAALRSLAYAAAALPAGLGLLTAIKDPEHRALHDRLTSTRVVKA